MMMAPAGVKDPKSSPYQITADRKSNTTPILMLLHLQQLEVSQKAHRARGNREIELLFLL